MHRSYFVFFFFFQAEDGIRYLTVTGVQTCALPISSGITDRQSARPPDHRRRFSRSALPRPAAARRSARSPARSGRCRSEEHTSELQSQSNLVCRLLLEKKKLILALSTHCPVRITFN